MAVAFSPDGHRVATGRRDGALQLWDPATGAQLGQTLVGQTGILESVAFSPDGHQIATTSLDGTLRLWNATVGQPMRGPDPVGGQVAFSPDGHRVAAMSEGDTTVQPWDVASGQALPPLTSSGTGAISFVFVDGGQVVTATDNGTVQVWDANTGQPARPPVHIDIPAGNNGRVAFSNDGRKVAAARDDDTVALWDVATGRALGQPMTVHAPDTILSGARFNGLAFSPDGHRLVAGYTDGLRLWNADTTQPDGTMLTNYDPLLRNPVQAVAFSRDGTTVAAGHVDGAIELWDVTTRKQLPDSPLHGHTTAVFSVAFGLPHQLASAGGDVTLRLWDTSTGAPTAEPLTRSDTVTSVAISPDGRLAASASMDGTVLLSPAIVDPSQLCDKLSTNMSHKQWRDWVSPGIGYITVCPGLPIAPD
jgi:WD40 repeat protein